MNRPDDPNLVRFKLEPNRRGFEPGKPWAALADHFVSLEEPASPAGAPVGAGQWSSQVKPGQP